MRIKYTRLSAEYDALLANNEEFQLQVRVRPTAEEDGVCRGYQYTHSMETGATNAPTEWGPLKKSNTRIPGISLEVLSLLANDNPCMPACRG